MFSFRHTMIAGLVSFMVGTGNIAMATCPILPEMVQIPAGKFTMGSPGSEDGRSNDESQHVVNVNRFSIGKYAVTFAEYACFIEESGGREPTDDNWGRGQRPVIDVSWFDAMAYAQWLSDKTGKPYRLPTEAEWEYAARAGTTTMYYWGDTIGIGRANCGDCSSKWNAKRTAPVGSFAPNPWGLYDMLGNVWQWTCSIYDREYSGGERICSTGNNANMLRALRGGAWNNEPERLRAADRAKHAPVFRDIDVGFRLVQDEDEPHSEK